MFVLVQEALPTTATHDSVRKVFEAYGPVAYVSLPKFRTSQQIKEFAFVEFESRSSVLKAINAFKDFGGILNMESDPERLISVTSYLKEQQENGNVEESTVRPQTAGDPMNDNNNEDEDDDKEATSNIDEQSESASATISESVADLADLSDADSVPGPAKRAKYDGGDDDEDEDEIINAKMAATSKGSGDENTRKKVRRKKTTAKHHKAIADEQSKNSINTLRITTKLEWKRLRNKYLNHQREQIKELKKQLWADRKPRSAQPPPLKEKKIIKNPRNINFYGAIKESKEEEDINEVAPINVLLDKKPLFSYEPGIIVKVHFDEPCVDVKDFKMDMRQHQFVKYIDVKEGDLAAFVRVDSARSAPTLIKHCAPHKCQILTGANEESYWEKINVDRQQKLTKSIKIKPKRGREKINKMLASHVRFED